MEIPFTQADELHWSILRHHQNHSEFIKGVTDRLQKLSERCLNGTFALMGIQLSFDQLNSHGYFEITHGGRIIRFSLDAMFLIYPKSDGHAQLSFAWRRLWEAPQEQRHIDAFTFCLDGVADVCAVGDEPLNMGKDFDEIILHCLAKAMSTGEIVT